MSADDNASPGNDSYSNFSGYSTPDGENTTRGDAGSEPRLSIGWAKESGKTIGGVLYVPAPMEELTLEQFYGGAGNLGAERDRILSTVRDIDGMKYMPYDALLYAEEVRRPFAKTGQGGFLDNIFNNFMPGAVMFGLPNLLAPGAFMGLSDLFGGGAGASGINAGGLDGVLGDSLTGQSWWNSGGSGSGIGFGSGGGNNILSDVFDFSSTYNSSTDPFGFTPNTGDGLSTGVNFAGQSGSTGLAQNLLSLGYTPAQLSAAGIDVSALNMGGGAGAMPTSGFGSTTAGGGFLNTISEFLKNPLIPGTNATGGNIAAALANYFMRQQQQDSLGDAANRSASLNDPMQQPQRFPFQLALNNLLLNPSGYSQTPYATGQNELARKAFEANVSKFGPGGTTFNDYLKNFQNIQSQDFFKLAEQFMTAGGFNQGTGGAGNAFGNLAGQAANAGLGAFEGFGRLLSTPPQTQNTNNNPFQITFNPVGNSSTISV